MINNLLYLKGRFSHQKNQRSSFGSPNLPVGCVVNIKHLVKLRNELEKILDEWKNNTLIEGALITVYYKNVIAKSNRIKALLQLRNESPNDSIRGSRFDGASNHPKHIFTHYVDLQVVQESIDRLNSSIIILNKFFSKQNISHDDINKINKDKNSFDELSRSKFILVIVDAYYVEKFSIDRDIEDMAERSIVTIYKTNVNTKELLYRIGIDMIEAKMLDETTVRLNHDEWEKLKSKAPFLIAMQSVDLSKLVKSDIIECDEKVITIPDPGNEPVIGVIDTPFDTNVYFSKWVTYHNLMDKDIPIEKADYEHGTAVSSIIVDGHNINPELEDGCGRFRIKHFGIATSRGFSSFTILKNIKEIVAANPEIKVWNFSLGSMLETTRNFISPEAAELDKIQNKYGVLFVVAGTNRPKDKESPMRIGAPADSLNSIVVNSVDFYDSPASYHRVGPVLSFFHKPDVSFYGGDNNKRIRVCLPCGEGLVAGTSFAAPWITRKLAYLIHKMGFSREVAKALLIDAAAGWNRKDGAAHDIGYGVVPKHIENIIKSPKDEIRFIMTGMTEEYESYAYNIPVPTHMDKYPFYARATLCYFPDCSRQQGVDYTETEMDIQFGRIKEEKGKAVVKSINKNRQGSAACYEEDARRLYRKWDNIKHISEEVKTNGRPRMRYGDGMWGLKITTKERLKTSRKKSFPFGVVITLKEMYGENRIADFIKLCNLRGWIVNEIDIHNRIEVYNIAEETLTLD